MNGRTKFFLGLGIVALLGASAAVLRQATEQRPPLVLSPTEKQSLRDAPGDYNVYTSSDYEVYFSTYESPFEASISTYGYRTPEKPITVDGVPQLFGDPQFVDFINPPLDPGVKPGLLYQRVAVVREGADYKVAVSLKAYYDDNIPAIMGYKLLRFEIPVAMGYPLAALNKVDYDCNKFLKIGDGGRIQIKRDGTINLENSDGTVRFVLVPNPDRAPGIDHAAEIRAQGIRKSFDPAKLMGPNDGFSGDAAQPQ